MAATQRIISPSEESAVDPMPPKPPRDPASHEYEFGETVDHDTAHRLSLAFGAVNKFPELVKRHRRFVGGATATAVVSTTAIILAYRAMHARMAKGESAVDALKRITEDEIEQSISLLKKIRRKK